MERFYDDNEEPDDESFFDPLNFDEETNEEIVGYIDQKGIIDVMQIDLDQVKLNQKLLDVSIKIAKNNWFWFFKNTEKRLVEIEKIYNKFSNLTELNQNSPIKNKKNL
jgi:hypothetical protein